MKRACTCYQRWHVEFVTEKNATHAVVAVDWIFCGLQSELTVILELSLFSYIYMTTYNDR